MQPPRSDTATVPGTAPTEEEVQHYVDSARQAFAKQECAIFDVRVHTLALLERIIARIGPDLLPLLCEPIVLERPRSSPSNPIAGSLYEVGGIPLKVVSQSLAGTEAPTELQRTYYLLANGTDGLEITRRVTAFSDLTTEWSTIKHEQAPLCDLVKAVRAPMIVDALLGRLKAQSGRTKTAEKLSKLANKLHAVLVLLGPE